MRLPILPVLHLDWVVSLGLPRVNAHRMLSPSKLGRRSRRTRDASASPTVHSFKKILQIGWSFKFDALKDIVGHLTVCWLQRMKSAAFVLLSIIRAASASCDTWPNGTDTAFHWWQCNSGPIKYYNAEPYDATGEMPRT
ncbi:hypothetical protein Y032_0422g1182 [Ancylostoma ceylanicum]|nr:hypothetical protein Y032_0422g1182 [Ancylostoma ceylanicum]